MHAAYTLRLCMRDVTVDGLKRDRLPWVGDLHLSLITNAFAFAEHRLFLRTLLAIYHPHPGEANFSGIFDFTLFWVIAAGNYFLYSGDETRCAAALAPHAGRAQRDGTPPSRPRAFCNPNTPCGFSSIGPTTCPRRASSC